MTEYSQARQLRWIASSDTGASEAEVTPAGTSVLGAAATTNAETCRGRIGRGAHGSAANKVGAKANKAALTTADERRMFYLDE
jgi:hypothetical protein